MEKKSMSWSKKTRELWKAFEDAVFARDKKQFEIYHKFAQARELDEKTQKQTQTEEELNLF